MSNPDARLSPAATPRAGVVPGEVDLDQVFDVDGLYALRASVAAHAAEHGVSADQVEHLVIVAGELATNAVRHAGGGGRLLLWREVGVVCVQVSDEGPGIADPNTGSTPPDVYRVDAGRGLWICRNLASELTIESGPGGVGAVVRAVVADGRAARGQQDPHNL